MEAKLLELRQLLVVNMHLTSREADIAELVTQGLSNNEISNQLLIQEGTVKSHLTSIYEKMNVKSRSQMIIYCLRYINYVDLV